MSTYSSAQIFRTNLAGTAAKPRILYELAAATPGEVIGVPVVCIAASSAPAAIAGETPLPAAENMGMN